MELEIKNYPQSAESYQVVHLDENNKVLLISKEFESLLEAREFANETKTALGVGKLEWRIVLIQRSALDLSSSTKIINGL